LSVPRVLVAIVSWNSARHVAGAVRSVPPGVPVVVVDNASADRSASVAREAGARVVDAGRNLGFGPACNLAAREGAPSETILFLNPDAALRDGAASLGELVAALDADPGLAAAAPRLDGAGQELFQLRRLPRAGSILREAFLFDRLFPSNRWLRRDRYLDRPRTDAFDVEQPAAAALLVRRADFEAVGGFDPAFAPAWFEDVDLCAKLLERGRRIRYVPSAVATHVGGVAMASLAWSDFRPLYVRNERRYLARHASPGLRLLAWFAAVAGALLRLALLPVVGGEHARPEVARAQLRVLGGLLGLGWRSALLSGGG
jgi:GT2 family glycosyltransferase